MQKIRHIIAHMQSADAYSKASHATRRKVGAILTHNGSPVACGWNGTPPGHPNACESYEGVTLDSVVHAEANAYKKLTTFQQDFESLELFVTCLPCVKCADVIIEHGKTKQVFFSEVYRSLEGAQKLLFAGVDLYYVQVNSDRVMKVVSCEHTHLVLEDSMSTLDLDGNIGWVARD